MKILVPIDGSEFSKHSIEFVTSRATLLGHNPEIELLSVQAPVPARASKLIGNGSLSGYYDEEANVILEPAIEALKAAGVKATARYAVGEAAPTIAKVAEESGANLIIMGSHGRSALKGLLLGSVTNSVLALCDKPVLILRNKPAPTNDSLKVGVAIDGSKYGEAAEVYYNLGNSYYKADDIAKAILNYERALLLQPGNADIRANLEIARSKTIDKVVSVPDIFFVAWVKSLTNCLSVDAWAKLGIVFFILLLISFSLFFFSKQIIWKKSGFIAGILFLVFTVLSNIFASEQKSELLDRNDAIVLSPSVTVRSTPSESGTGLFVLHEGHKIEIKDNSMREWKEIRLEDGKVGWIPASAIEVI